MTNAKTNAKTYAEHANTARSETRRSLRDWRLARGLTQVELAGAARVGLTSVRDIEHGRQVPTIATVMKLARALEVTLEMVHWPEKRTASA